MHIAVIGNGQSGMMISNYIREICPVDFRVTYFYQYESKEKVEALPDIKRNKFIKIKNNLMILYQYLIDECDIVISCGWCYKVPNFAVATGKFYNIHASLLPEYRGLGAVEKQYREKVDYIGVTMHQMDAGFDTGPVFAQAKIKLRKCMDLDFIIGILIKSAKPILEVFFLNYPNIRLVSQNSFDFYDKIIVLEMEWENESKKGEELQR